MDIFSVALVVAVIVFVLKTREQRRRIALLATHLGQFQIEKLMETLAEGYLRALGEKEALRRNQVWAQLDSSEERLVGQFSRFAMGFAKVDEADTRVSTLPIAVPYADRLLPSLTFDLRKALQIHAEGFANTAANTGQLSPRDKAFRMSAELFLMQHTCHWYCRSKAVASARLIVRHQTPYEQVLASVSPETRAAYGKLIAG
ncbi:MAG: hypothetical protein EOO28_12155 [Comamonadaceae bacterium]|nr:MAG: hypothetical protein EOO28_12155 [Comamonadaceae bacterium]